LQSKGESVPTTESLPVSKLSIDLNNFRTTKQENEADAILALIAIDTDWFYELARSLMTDGYLLTENIVVLKERSQLTVQEGNRRVAILKLAFEYSDRSAFSLPDDIEQLIGGVSAEWRKQNKKIPCAIYSANEREQVDRIVSLTHGKDEKAGRAKWKAIARARHNRDRKGKTELGLDLLEKYLLKHGQITPETAKVWAGDYPITILDEALTRYCGNFGFESSLELVSNYPKVNKHKSIIDKLVIEIGRGNLPFKSIRQASFATSFGLPKPKPSPQSDGVVPQVGMAAGSVQPEPKNAPPPTAPPSKPTSKAPPAKSSKTQAALVQKLQSLTLNGTNRQKMRALVDEMISLDLNTHPYAFCFLLRSAFELSAKAYCLDLGGTPGAPTLTKSDGKDRALLDVLRDTVAFIEGKDKNAKKELHGSMVELGDQNSILSVTSMNQLVHNPNYAIDGNRILTVFQNVFPLLFRLNA
jgi:hypothetical protein